MRLLGSVLFQILPDVNNGRTIAFQGLDAILRPLPVFRVISDHHQEVVLVEQGL